MNNKENLEIRVASGEFRGRKITCPPGEIRPMTSKVKQALYNILFGREEITLLDLFSGSGSITIEGFSRGMVKTADIVEVEFDKKTVITENIKSFKLEDSVKIHITDVFNYLRKCEKKYDVIIADPPFRMTNKDEILKIIQNKKLLATDGIVIAHVPKKDPISEEIGDLIMFDRRNYGVNALCFYHDKINSTT